MEIKFCGAAKNVTGSRHLLILEDGYKILLDCGMYQGAGINTYDYNANFLFEPKEVDAVIISHAHIDHTGALPRLARLGFKGKVYCTPATIDLCKIMLNDSAFIQRNDLKYLNQRRQRRGEPPVEPLYDENDVTKIIDMMVPIDYHERTQVHPGFEFEYSDAAHIIGSAAITIFYQEKEAKQKVLTFTGDIGRPDDQILKDPECFPQSDYIICESTYGDRLHEANIGRDEQLYDIVTDTCVKRKGKLIIPAFSIDRTQELIYSFDRLVGEGKLPPIPVYVDSPLSVQATNITRKYRKYYNNRLTEYLKTDAENDAFDFPSLKYISKVDESKSLNSSDDPCIIISASGMAEAGRIKHHIRNSIENPRNTILMVGYCTPDSLGGQLKSGNREVKIFGEMYKVKSRIAVMDSYSAHGDYKEMIKYLLCQDSEKVKEIFLVHGEPEVQKAFSNKLQNAGFKKVYIPNLGETVLI